MILLSLLCFSNACKSFELVSAQKTRIVPGRKSGTARINYTITLKVKQKGLTFDELITHQGVVLKTFNIKNLATGMETSNQILITKGTYQIRYHTSEDLDVNLDQKAQLILGYRGKSKTLTLEFEPTPDQTLR